MSNAESQALQAIDALPIDKAAVGRPTLFSDQLSAYICGRIAAGETLTAICKTPGLPVPATVHRWRREDKQFNADYTAARVDQMESWGDEVIEIADDDTMDTMDGVDKQGNSIQVANHANVQRDRLRVDTRKFLMGKIAPRIYGDRVSHEHSGEVGHTHTIELSDRERMRRLATFMLEDRAAGVVIEGQIEEQPANLAMTGDVAQPQPEKVSAQTVQASPADIIQGVNLHTDDQSET